MHYEIILAGFGGQGILSAGRIIGSAGMIEGRNVTWFPSYGPEMRGGTANCHVIVSEEDIGSPVINNPDVLICMTRPAMDKFEKTVKEGGFILADSSLIGEERISESPKNVIAVPAAEMAVDLGHKAMAMLIMIGRLARETNVVKRESVEKALYEVLKGSLHHLIPEEMKAFDEGWKKYELYAAYGK